MAEREVRLKGRFGDQVPFSRSTLIRCEDGNMLSIPEEILLGTDCEVVVRWQEPRREIKVGDRVRHKVSSKAPVIEVLAVRGYNWLGFQVGEPITFEMQPSIGTVDDPNWEIVDG